MRPNRDDFTKPTTEILAKRVSYLCSNPDCRRTTIGAHELTDKSTSIGIAAHITAAASGGPRYDDTFTPEQRSHIDNGIWLCSNCAALIDKDFIKYPLELLRKWKEDAEDESSKKLRGEIYNHPKGKPYLEVDLILTTRLRTNRGYSDKNPIEKIDGAYVMNLSNVKPIIHWGIYWTFNFVIYNNSNYPAYNVKIESIGDEHFIQLDPLPNVNNLPPLKNIDLKAKFGDFIEGDHLEADKLMHKKIPDRLKAVQLKLTYRDDALVTHTNYIEFTETGIKNSKV